ncbi:uncharacterized protein [Nicotiana tomentosiformis]|uniref:uncharacterized protein n=1 Tax=Nicotiana tomentosiformis TaxID=4098 RepID=UPI00388C8AB9
MNFIDPIPVGMHNQPAYCAHVEEETDGNPWFHDIKEYLAKGEIKHKNSTAYMPQMNRAVEAANKNIKKILRKMNRMSRAFNKRVRPRQFTLGQLVLKQIFLHQDEAKGNFSPNWKGPYMVHRVLAGGALILTEMDGEVWPKPINSDAVKRYFV